VSRLLQFMRIRIALPSCDEVVRALAWIREGIGVFLPDGVRRFGWRVQNRLVYLKPGQHVDKSVVVEKSWFGEGRFRSGDSADDIPVSFILHSDDVFTTDLSLPAVAAKSFAKAATFRLAEVSPIPPEDAAVAIGKVRTHPDGRAVAKIAITKKRYLREIRDRRNRERILVIGAEPDEVGAPAFVFSRCAAGAQGLVRRRLVDAAVFFAALLFLTVAIDSHQQRRLLALKDHEEQALSELRSLRPVNALFADVDAADLALASGRSVASAVTDIRGALGALPADALVTELGCGRQEVSIRGFAPSASSETENRTGQLSLSASDRPGYDRFEFTFPLGESS